MKYKVKLAAAVTLALGASSVVNATTYNISGVLNGVDGGFGFSGFHYAGDLGPAGTIDGDGNNQTGSQLMDIPQAFGSFGTYDDVTGAFDVTLATNSTIVTDFNLSGNMTYDTNGFLDPNSTLDITFSLNTGNPLLPTSFTTQMDFSAGQVCCTGTNAPNSFNNNLMSLWGVNNTPELTDLFPGYNSEILGLDLRMELTPVPVPAAVWLFGSGILGLLGIARRKV